MSLEHAREIMNKPQMRASWLTGEDDTKEILTAQLLVDLIEEVRLLRIDLQKMNQMNREVLK